MKKKFVLVLVIVFILSTSVVAYAENYVTALYGGDINGDDAIDFANAIDGLSGWSKSVVDTTGIVKQFKDGDNTSAFLYWSGHGLTTGKMSCYGIDSQTGYIDYSDADAPIMHSHIGSTKYYDSYSQFYYSYSNWNNTTKCVVLAACNQIGTNSTLTNNWKNTMYGSPNRVNMILGYAGTAPGDWVSSENDYRDDLIAKKFVTNMGNGMEIRNAWYSANTSYGISYSSTIYNQLSATNKITSMSSLTVTNNPTPSIILEKNGVVQTSSYLSATQEDEYSKTNIDDMLNYSFDVTNKVLSCDTDSTNYNDYYFDENNIYESVITLTKYLNETKVLSQDACFEGVDQLELTTLENEDSEYSMENGPKSYRYVIKYGQKINNIKVSNLFNGSYVHVYITDGKISMIDKNWLEFSREKIEKDTKKLIDKDKAIDKANKIIESYKDENKKIKFKDCQPTYFVDSDNNVLIGWQVYYDGITLTIDAAEE